MQPPDDFVKSIAHALNHLYDPDALRQHPLKEYFGLPQQSFNPSLLRERLILEIEKLKPEPSVPIDSRVWRVYKVLQLRYIQQVDQEQTAHQLGVGVRHLRREQQVAIRTLADSIYQNVSRTVKLGQLVPESLDRVIEGELSWLKEPDQAIPIDVVLLLSQAFDLVKPLATARSVDLSLQPLPELPSALFVPAALRQALISMISYAIRRISTGRVVIKAEQQKKNDSILVSVSSTGILTGETEDTKAILHAIHLLLGEQSKSLHLSDSPSGCVISISIPTHPFTRVLMVDDNSDVADLFKRYTFGSPYRIEHIAKPDMLFKAVEEVNPDIIILDIMIPGVDGWELLGRLRQHPLTSQIPVVVCSVLPERELALALGAIEFLAKPTSRHQLLSALGKVS
ncbi:response regulator containing a CheY-like receiver domain and a GGDEF domain [Anaerolinea thermolimosa]|uniref:response regulator n=1 Tax=Anaerolinea thermolimosa TaxID=229919 RepID=UPI000784D109|nr:response regulator [Anaerolinea thermolimosa]GAP05187.1 response regulator containing a CheY-like receiver domain and a GGDEF domain [Anaerolinea thermolimosa]